MRSKVKKYKMHDSNRGKSLQKSGIETSLELTRHSSVTEAINTNYQVLLLGSCAG